MTLPTEVTTVADARNSLSRILSSFRGDPSASPVVLGSHRKPEAVLVPFAVFANLAAHAGESRSVLAEIRDKSALIKRLAAINNIESVAVFGSVARGTERADSDIDVLVGPSDDATYFDLAQFAIDLEQLFDREVDVLSRRALDPADDAGILEEAVPI